MGIFIGLVAGFINGLFGSGAGMIVLPGLISVMKLDSKVARGTSLFILVVVSVVTCFFYVRNITDYTALWFITVGGILGGVIGSKFSKTISEKWLKIALGIMMLISGVRMFLR